MLTTEAIEKAIEMFEGGATDSAVAEETKTRPEEAKAVGDALYLGETERLFRLSGHPKPANEGHLKTGQRG